MIDHVFINLVNAIQQSLETSMLEPLPNEDHLLLDVYLGDMHFESAYTLPGETYPANVRADIALEWPVWSQSSYRSLLQGESEGEAPEVGLEITLRALGLSSPASIEDLIKSLDERSPEDAQFLLERSQIIASQNIFSSDSLTEYEIEITYDGSISLDEDTIQNKEELSVLISSLGPWLASILVRFSDQPMKFFPKPID